jgi:competence protein ComEC
MMIIQRGVMNMNSKDNKFFKSMIFKIGIVFMLCVIFIVGIAMANPLIAQRQVVAAQQIAEKLTTLELGEGSNLDEEKSNSYASVNGELKIHFINVGQADSILIHQGNTSMLIDAGNNADSNTVKDYITQQGIAKLDYVVGTHPHEDHSATRF